MEAVVFFFQAEDGIRDGRVTGVQTCALPIWSSSSEAGWFFKDGGLSPTATGSSVLVYPYLDGSSVIQASVGATFATLVLNARQKLARITIEPDSISVDVNSSADFNVAGVDARNSRYDGPAQLTLASSDSAVARPVLMAF